MPSKLLIGTILVLFGAATASAHDGDIGIRVTGGKLETVLASGEPPSQVFGTAIERVFAAEWVFNATTMDVRIDEPGLASEATALNGQNLGFNIFGGLGEWNGSDLGPSTLTAAVGGSDLGLPFINTPMSGGAVAGHTITVPATPFDFHYDWRLNGATANSGFGIYVVAIELTNPGGTMLTSDPVFIVFNYGMPEADHDAAIGFVVANYVPTPGAACGLLFAASFLRRRARR